jgi:hypothetical protein
VIATYVECLEEGPCHPEHLDAMGELLSFNAALSRFTSQLFSGTPAVQLSECHFWTHSLFGVGTAIRGLRQIARSVERVLDRARIPDRLGMLASPERSGDLCDAAGWSGLGSKQLVAEGDTSTVWTVRLNQIGEHEIPVLLEGHPTCREDLDALAALPAIPYFSARDGFRSTPAGVSAALSCVGNANSSDWNLSTLTHEMSHRLVQDALVILLPSSASGDSSVGTYSWSRAAEIFDEGMLHSLPKNLLDAYRLCLLKVLVAMDRSRSQDRTPTSEQQLRDVVRTWHHECEELMAHIVDYMVFNNGRAAEEDYITDIWRSWSVIPGIDSKVRYYVLRSICSMMARYPSRGDGMILTAVDRLGEILSQKVMPNVANPDYIRTALGHLSRKGTVGKRPLDRLVEDVRLRLPLIRLTRSLLCQDWMIQKLGIPEDASGRRDRHGFEWSIGEQFEDKVSPLLFSRAYGREDAADTAESWWLFSVLAFNSDQG